MPRGRVTPDNFAAPLIYPTSPIPAHTSHFPGCCQRKRVYDFNDPTRRQRRRALSAVIFASTRGEKKAELLERDGDRWAGTFKPLKSSLIAVRAPSDRARPLSGQFALNRRSRVPAHTTGQRTSGLPRLRRAVLNSAVRPVQFTLPRFFEMQRRLHF